MLFALGLPSRSAATGGGGRGLGPGSLCHKALCCSFGGLSKVYRACGFRVGWLAMSGNRSGAESYNNALNLLSGLRCATPRQVKQGRPQTGCGRRAADRLPTQSPRLAGVQFLRLRSTCNCHTRLCRICEKHRFSRHPTQNEPPKGAQAPLGSAPGLRKAPVPLAGCAPTCRASTPSSPPWRTAPSTPSWPPAAGCTRPGQPLARFLEFWGPSSPSLGLSLGAVGWARQIIINKVAQSKYLSLIAPQGVPHHSWPQRQPWCGWVGRGGCLCRSRHVGHHLPVGW